MKTDFICPKCNGHLLVGDKIIFLAITKKDKRSGIILLSPKLGDYTSLLHPTFKIKEREEVDFFCPICHANLTATDIDEKLAKIVMVDEKSDKYEIYFSGVTGEYCTYKVLGNKIEKFGDASDTYYKYFINRNI
ncbi:MAG: hypothetical protein A2041_00770 [Bacteroidetes bacterium GWA2_31_9b]|nr:MAG: hypothetical protein A2041_00770 [Bacteroidetes bacterium GWA2_31_9b]